MVEYNKVNFRLSDLQLNKLKSVFLKKKKSNMNNFKNEYKYV